MAIVSQEPRRRPDSWRVHPRGPSAEVALGFARIDTQLLADTGGMTPWRVARPPGEDSPAVARAEVAPPAVSEFTTCEAGGMSLMRRDMRDSRAHVEASGGRPQGRLQGAVRHGRGGRVGISRQQLTRLLRRYRDGGLDGPRATFPPTPAPTRATRRTRSATGSSPSAGIWPPAGLDAGPVTIAWHLGREGLPVPSVSTIRRALHAAGLVVPEPHKRPRSSWIRFEAAAPNEVWQADFTHWRLGDGSEVEIPSWLDDHSRYLLGCTVFRRVGGDDVVATFTAAGDAYGWPAATLTDNGTVYTTQAGRRPQRPRAPARVPRHPPEERQPGPPPDPGQDRAVPPDPEALAGTAADARGRSPRSRPARRLPRGLQRAAAAPGDRPADPGRGVPGDPHGAAIRTRRPRPLPPPLRHDGQQGRHYAPACRAAAPPQGRRRHTRALRVLAIVDEQEVTVVALTPARSSRAT